MTYYQVHAASGVRPAHVIMSRLGLDIKELKRTKLKAVVIVHDEKEANMFSNHFGGRNCCQVLNKDDVVKEKCIVIVTTYELSSTVSKKLHGFSRLVVFLDRNPIKTVKDLKKFSLRFTKTKKKEKVVALLVTYVISLCHYPIGFIYIYTSHI